MSVHAKLLHPATAIATVALFAALGGPSWAAGLVGTSQLRNNAVTAPKLAPNSVSSLKVRAGAITQAKLAGASVATAKLADGAITAPKLGAGAVTRGALSMDAVGADQLAAASVGASELADGAITTSKLAPASVGADQLKRGEVVLGGGRILSGEARPADTTTAQLVEAPGLMRIEILCAGIPVLHFTSLASEPIRVYYHGVVDTPQDTALGGVFPMAPGELQTFATSSLLGRGGSLTLQVIAPGPASRITTITTSASKDEADKSCPSVAQVVSSA